MLPRLVFRIGLLVVFVSVIFSFFIGCTFLTDSSFLVDNLLTVTSAGGNVVEVRCRNLVIMSINITAFNGFDFFIDCRD